MKSKWRCRFSAKNFIRHFIGNAANFASGQFIQTEKICRRSCVFSSLIWSFWSAKTANHFDRAEILGDLDEAILNWTDVITRQSFKRHQVRTKNWHWGIVKILVFPFPPHVTTILQDINQTSSRRCICHHFLIESGKWDEEAPWGFPFSLMLSEESDMCQLWLLH